MQNADAPPDAGADAGAGPKPEYKLQATALVTNPDGSAAVEPAAGPDAPRHHQLISALITDLLRLKAKLFLCADDLSFLDHLLSAFRDSLVARRQE